MSRDIFDAICNDLEVHSGVEKGKMMSSPALKYNGKVFTFYHDRKMCFKLGDPSILEDANLPVILLSPFKTKGPLKGWFWVDETNADNWSPLAQKALKIIQG